MIRGVRLATPGMDSRITFSSGAYHQDARLLEVSDRQIEGVVPEGAPLGRIQIAVTRGTEKSRIYEQAIVSSSVGIYAGDRTPAVRPGDRVVFRATGAGDERRPRILVGAQSVVGAATRGRDGVDQIAFEVPQSALRGCSVPVAVRSGGHMSNFVSISVGKQRGSCNAPPEYLRAALVPGQNAAALLLVRSTFLPAMPRGATSNDEMTRDQAAAVFLSMNPKGSSLLRSLPTPGSCTAYAGNFNPADLIPDSATSMLLGLIEGKGLDAGSQLLVRTAGAHQSLLGSAFAPGIYQGDLGGSAFRPGAPTPLFFDAGPAVVSGGGGKDVGPFQSSIRIPAEFEWTNRKSVQAIDRTRGATLEWRRTGRERAVLILAFNTDALDPATGLALCVAEPESNRFTLPPDVLANVPATQRLPGIPVSGIVVAAIGWDPPEKPVTGLQTLLGAGVRVYGKNIEYH